MNTNTDRGLFSRTLTAAAVAALVVGALTSTAPSAAASEPRQQARPVSTNSTALYGAPLSALGGDTLAQYLSDHWAQEINPGI